MRQHILIIGGGAVGCFSALELAKRHYRVTLCDRGLVGQESSWAGGGILFPLLPWFYREPVNQLALAGASAYVTLAEALRVNTGIDPEFVRCGMMVSGAVQKEQALDWCEAHGIRVESINDSLWLPGVAQARNPRLMKALYAQLSISGVEILEQAELNPLHTQGTRISSWRSADGRLFNADIYLLTEGAWSRVLLGEHALQLDIRPMRGQMLLYQANPGDLPHIVYRDDFYLIPRLDGLILAGSTVEDAGFDKSTTQHAAADLHRKAVALMPGLSSAPIVKHWSGLRPGSRDNVPVIARHPVLENLFLNTGHFRYGVTMGPSSASLLADLIDGRPSPLVKDYAYPEQSSQAK